MAHVTTFIKNLFPPKTRFRPGDEVQSIPGGPLMILQWIKFNRQNKSSGIHCKGFDDTTKSTCTNLFKEDQLLPFYWNNPC